MTHLPGAYEEETEALRFLDGFGTPLRLCELLLHDGAERDGTGGRQGCCLLPAPRRGSKCGAEPAVELQSQERKGWLTWVSGRLVQAGGMGLGGVSLTGGSCGARGRAACGVHPLPAPWLLLHPMARTALCLSGQEPPACGQQPEQWVRGAGGCSWPQ